MPGVDILVNDARAAKQRLAQITLEPYASSWHLPPKVFGLQQIQALAVVGVLDAVTPALTYNLGQHTLNGSTGRPEGDDAPVTVSVLVIGH